MCVCVCARVSVRVRGMGGQQGQETLSPVILCLCSPLICLEQRMALPPSPSSWEGPSLPKANFRGGPPCALPAPTQGWDDRRGNSDPVSVSPGPGELPQHHLTR